MKEKKYKTKLPILNIILLALSATLFIVGIILFVMVIKNKYPFEWLEILGPTICGFSLSMGLLMFILSIQPFIDIMRIRRNHYTQNLTMDIQEELASDEADISGRGIRKRVSTIKEAMSYPKNCPFCNSSIVGNEEYCTKCGQKLYKKCNNCNAINSSENLYCVKCGKKL